MIRLYIDENVEGAITRGVRRRGFDVLTAQEDGRGGVDDPPLLDRAGELGVDNLDPMQRGPGDHFDPAMAEQEDRDAGSPEKDDDPAMRN